MHINFCFTEHSIAVNPDIWISTDQWFILYMNVHLNKAPDKKG